MMINWIGVIIWAVWFVGWYLAILENWFLECLFYCMCIWPSSMNNEEIHTSSCICLGYSRPKDSYYKLHPEWLDKMSNIKDDIPSTNSYHHRSNSADSAYARTHQWQLNLKVLLRFVWLSLIISYYDVNIVM